jgi:hypothetical protein
MCLFRCSIKFLNTLVNFSKQTEDLLEKDDYFIFTISEQAESTKIQAEINQLRTLIRTSSRF